ncbi:hypothetical protein [Phyllobacterium sp. UNC302MFCol5.2]|uniref:hypothetical protein n=1 Tax=Phyllobacterium sp. UNC302MFCol5.2 TaxID=1449065 RepID=UPI0004861662|nr:hypothetical protein [Phyllobacterium sp. UNC302MFCol5.2]
MSDGFVYIVESPSATDFADRRTEGSALCEAFNLSRTKHSYCIAVNKEQFLLALSIKEPGNRFGTAVAHHGCMPVLHLSMHGFAEGIQLTDGTVISWAELRDILSPINEALPNGLMIAFSTCGGGSSIRMNMREEEHERPFFATIGSFNNILYDDALVAFIAFYHNLFKGKSVQECVAAMKAASGDQGFAVYSGPEEKQQFIQYMQRERLIAALRVPNAASRPTGGLLGLLTPSADTDG